MSISLSDLQAAGFPMGGEPLVALDLVDTLLTRDDPVTDLLDSPERRTAWWDVESTLLPHTSPPDPAAVRRLRAAIRDLVDAHLDQRAPLSTSIEDVNAAAAAVPASLRLVHDETGPRADTRWHTEHGGNPALAAIAREAIELLSSERQLARLRRCANPTCSMVFLAETKRRVWCAGNVCGNRVRVARHYQRTHTVAS
jgi:predicted RNA-binding Zn ribbon-like protein